MSRPWGAVLRRFVVFLHVIGQLMMRVILLAYLAVALAERAIPIFLAFSAVSFIFSIYLHGQSGWVITALFMFPILFLGWHSSNSSDLFGWKRRGELVRHLLTISCAHTQADQLKDTYNLFCGLQDNKTRILRLMILWRFIENLGSVAVVLLFPAVNPCTPASHDVRYLSEYCSTCCRGPIVYLEFIVVMIASSFMYAGSWVAGWFLDNYYFKTDS